VDIWNDEADGLACEPWGGMLLFKRDVLQKTDPNNEKEKATQSTDPPKKEGVSVRDVSVHRRIGK